MDKLMLKIIQYANYYVLQYTGYRIARQYDDNDNFQKWCWVKMKPGTGWIK